LYCGNTGGFCDVEPLGVSIGVGGMGAGITGMGPGSFGCSSFTSNFATALAPESVTNHHIHFTNL